jgi:hypothetical protein
MLAPETVRKSYKPVRQRYAFFVGLVDPKCQFDNPDRCRVREWGHGWV